MGVFWEPLGLLEALLGSFKSEKVPTVPRENHLFVHAVFWALCSLNGFLELGKFCVGWLWFENGFLKVFETVMKS